MEYIIFGFIIVNYRVGRYYRILMIVFGFYMEYEFIVVIEVYKI